MDNDEDVTFATLVKRNGQLRAALLASQERFDEHTKSVSWFLNDLYSTMIDPCATGSMSVAEIKSALLKVAEANRDALDRLPLEVSKLQAFKDFVHRRLDTGGIEKNPNGKHSKAGCRIGDRLDIVLNGLAASQLECERLRGALSSIAFGDGHRNKGKSVIAAEALSTPPSPDALAAHDREVEAKFAAEQAKKDVYFLKEIQQRLLKARDDITEHEMLTTMIADWLDELRRMAAEREPKP